MQFKRSLFAVAFIGALLSAPKIKAEDHIGFAPEVKLAVACAAALTAGFIYQHTPSIEVNRSPLTKALDTASIAAHKATALVSKWAPTAAFAGLIGWAVYHNTNANHTVLAHFVRSLPHATHHVK
jgi:hypothetical protein